MKRVREIESSKHLCEPFSLEINNYFQEENHLLSRVQNRVIRFQINTIRRMRERVVVCVDDLEESYNLIERTYCDMVETRIKELEMEGWPVEEIVGEIRVIDWYHHLDILFLKESITRLTLGPRHFLSLFNDPGIEVANQVLMSGACYNPLIFLSVSKSTRRLLLENQPLIASLVEKTDIFVWLNYHLKSSSKSLLEHYPPLLLLRLVQLDNDFREKVDLLYQAAIKNRAGMPYSTAYGCDQYGKNLKSFLRCYCLPCRFRRYATLPIPANKRLGRDCPDYIRARDTLLESRCLLLDYLYLEFQVSLS